MLLRFSAIRTITLLIIFLRPLTAEAQILQDTSTLNLVRENVGCIYNLQFGKAREIYTTIVRRYPSHPIVYLLRGLTTYWENYPLLHTSSSHNSFEDDMHECIKISEKNDNPDHEAEYLLANLSARGMLLMFYDDNDLIMEVTPLTISTYKYIRRAFDLTSASVDLYYFTGLYNYFREAYPEAYPVYKSLAFLFPRGNTAMGLNQLQKAADNSIVLRAEAAILLIWINLAFENDPQQSTDLCRFLFNDYPGNGIFRTLYIRNLLIMRDYDEAEILLSSHEEKDNSFIQGQLAILKGILQEKKYEDLHLANIYYLQGIRKLSGFDKYGHEFAAYGYFGLSRINESDDKKNRHKTYRKEALKLAEFKKVTFDK